ncbi:MAG: hypothetical protein V3V81_07925 [Candidatus Bathyarchaeia archaeon]
MTKTIYSEDIKKDDNGTLLERLKFYKKLRSERINQDYVDKDTEVINETVKELKRRKVSYDRRGIEY